MRSKKARSEMQTITGLKHEVVRKNQGELRSWQKKLSQKIARMCFRLIGEHKRCIKVRKLP